jgi:hypothetical protein
MEVVRRGHVIERITTGQTFRVLVTKINPVCRFHIEVSRRAVKSDGELHSVHCVRMYVCVCVCVCLLVSFRSESHIHAYIHTCIHQLQSDGVLHSIVWGVRVYWFHFEVSCTYIHTHIHSYTNSSQNSCIHIL